MVGIRTEARVGILICIAVVVLIGGAMFLKGYHPGRRGYLLVTKMSNVSGLTSGSPVTIAGLKVGKVRSMEWAPPFVKVTLWIDSHYNLYQGSVAQIKDVGFMGDKCIEIQPGKDEGMINNGDVIQSKMTTSVYDLPSQAKEMMEEIHGVVSEFQSTMDNESMANIRVSIANARKTTDILQKDIKKILQDFKKVSSQYSEMGSNERNRIQQILQNLDKGSAAMKTTSVKLDSVSSTMEIILSNITRGKGTLGQMVNDDSLYVNLKELTLNLNLLSEDIRKNPKKYLHFSIF